MKIVKRAAAGAKCDHHKMKVRTRVRARRHLDVRGAWSFTEFSLKMVKSCHLE
jgi:hypothetical protein